jgi:predicted NBD/HSP70 family sugar kinase
VPVQQDDLGHRSETVRRANLSLIIRELHRRGALSRSELVARTGLTRSAIRGLIGELVASGLVAESRATGRGTPGRPSPLVTPVAAAATVLALDIEVDSLAAAIVGLGGDVLDEARVDRPRESASVDQVVGVLAGLAATLRPTDRPADSEIGIGVAVVGVVRQLDGVVSTAPNLGWADVGLRDAIAQTFGANVPIQVANEANLGALAEARRGAAVGADDVLFLSGEVGIGGGIIIDGGPFTGTAGYGGEVGHMPVDPMGRPCRCGAVGCWETQAGSESLLRRAGRPATGGRAAVAALLADAQAGSPDALDALEETGRWIGIGLAGLVNVLDPRLVVFGGLFGRIHPFVSDIVEAELDRRALAAPRRLVRIVPSKLGVEASLLGAAELAMEPLLADPARWMRPRETDARSIEGRQRRVVA